VRQPAAKTLTPDPLTAYLEVARDEALSNVRALLADDGPELPGFPRARQIENALTAAEAAARRLDLFAAVVAS